MAGNRRQLGLRCSGHPSTASLTLDGEPLTFVSRVELVLDVNGEATARLTIPAPVLDIDVEAAAFVTAHSAADDNSSSAHPQE